MAFLLSSLGLCASPMAAPTARAEETPSGASPSQSASVATTPIYVDGTNGKDTNDGLNVETPVQGFDKAYELAEKQRKSKNADMGSIVLVGDTYFSPNGKASPDKGYFEKHYSDIILPGYPMSISAQNDVKLIFRASSINLQAATLFHDLYIDASYVSGSCLVANGYALTFGQGVTYQWKDNGKGTGYKIVGGGNYRDSVKGKLTINPGSDLTFESGDYAIVLAGFIGNSAAEDGVFDQSGSEAYNVIVRDGAHIQDLYTGGMADTFERSGIVKYPGANVSVEGGKVDSLYGGTYGLGIFVAKQVSLSQGKVTVNVSGGEVGDLVAGSTIGAVSPEDTQQAPTWTVTDFTANITGGKVGTITPGNLMVGLSGYPWLDRYDHVVNARADAVTIVTSIDLSKTPLHSGGAFADAGMGDPMPGEKSTTNSLTMVVNAGGVAPGLTDSSSDNVSSAVSRTLSIEGATAVVPSGAGEGALDYTGLSLAVGGTAIIAENHEWSTISSDGNAANAIQLKTGADGALPQVKISDKVQSTTPIGIAVTGTDGTVTAPKEGTTLISFNSADAAQAGLSSFKLVVPEGTLGYGLGVNGADLVVTRVNATVSFDSNGGSEVPSQSVILGERAAKPDNPSKAGYSFAGWYSDKELSQAYDFTVPVTADLTLYAKWTRNSGGGGGGGSSGGGSTVTPSKPQVVSPPSNTDVPFGGQLDLSGLEVDFGDGMIVDAEGVTVSGIDSSKPGAQTATLASKKDDSKKVDINVLVMFKDMDDTTPHHEEIRSLLAKDITRGFPDGTFRGMASLNRQDLAAFLYRMAGQPDYEPAKADFVFADVDESTPHYREILWAAKNGVVTGFTADDGTRTYAGGKDILRQDLIAMLHRLAGGPAADNASSFTDVTAQTPHAQAIAWAKQAGVSTGFPDGTFRGGQTILRQDAAAFLGRVTSKGLVAF